MSSNDLWKKMIVDMIRGGEVEEALALLAKRYGVVAPKLRVGTVKGHRKVLGCYLPTKMTIYISTSDIMTQPFVVLHEFYHHLRAVESRFAGSEKHAERFAMEFLVTLKGRLEPM